MADSEQPPATSEAEAGGGFARRVLGAALIAFLIPVIRVYRLAVFLITLYT